LIYSGTPVHIVQWYLNRDKNRVVRVRIRGEEAFLTIKGANNGIVRTEFEYNIPYSEALAMLPLADGKVIDKTRWTLDYGGHTWEVDEFHGDLSGLILAEVELESEDEEVDLPIFVEREVSDDPRYYNSNLAQ
ncbi:MAG: CYTH domain-containing protein, partial [Muribaculaceae bacterium]|nr:CYTH domain-containing protein [Muribaculaceae bacterium]